MKYINEIVEKKERLNENILQFGEGNFLRAFVDWMVDKSNKENNRNDGIVIVQPIKVGLADKLNKQNSLYTLVMRGKDENGEKEIIEKIKSVSRAINPYLDFESYKQFVESKDLKVVVSNTTEAGISFKEEEFESNKVQNSFPAKVCQLLYFRFKKFKGDKDKGLLFLPVELIDDNGNLLKKYVLMHANNWNLEKEFIEWIEDANEFASTLVDRIVTGRPLDKDYELLEKKIGYKDDLIDTSELFNLWVIEASESAKKNFKVEAEDVNIVWTNNVSPYKKRKVRILNGSHTSTVPLAILGGYSIVRDFMNDQSYKKFLNDLLDHEVIPYIDMEKEELDKFKEEVFMRFENPYVDHKLTDILLNSISKFKARCMPSIKEYISVNKLVPHHFALALAALINLYRVSKEKEVFVSKNEKGSKIFIRDEVDILEEFSLLSDKDYLEKAYEKFVGDFDNTEFKKMVLDYYKLINEKGSKKVIEDLNEKIYKD